MINNEKIKKDILSLAADMKKVAEKISVIAASIPSSGQQDDQAEMPRKKAKRVSKTKTASSRIETEEADKSTATQAVPA